MKIRLYMAAAALLAFAGLAAGCGGDDSGSKPQTGQIQTQKGLSVAAIGALQAGGSNTQAGQLSADTSRSTAESALPAADISSSNRGVSGGSLSAPQLVDGGGGVTVQGYGSASAQADSAAVEFYFASNYYGSPKPLPGMEGGTNGSSGSGSAPGVPVPDITTPQQVAPITEADLQPVIDAIASAGVSRGDIKFISQGYDVYSSSATLRVTVKNVGAVDGVVQAGSNAAVSVANIAHNGTSVSYTVSDCSALEKAAMQAAVSDASERATAFAQALGVGLGAITSASNYSYAPFGGTPCDTGGGVPYPMGINQKYASGQTQDVQVVANISVTYGIK
jgi:uncharacterized protein YggE